MPVARVRLDSLLAERGLFESRTRAAAAVIAGQVHLGPGRRRAEKPGQLVDAEIELGLDQVEMVLLLLTLAVNTLTFTGGRTNVLQGAVHLVLFFAFLVLIFER